VTCLLSMQTYCAGYVKALPYLSDPMFYNEPPMYRDVECKVIPSMMCCFPMVRALDLQSCGLSKIESDCT
jgi:hypothetical protein